jgi:hypothetical protein
MLKQKDTNPIEVTISQFTEFNRDIFFDDDIIPDEYTPLTYPANHHISPAELTDILEHRYKATKSRGLSELPPQLLKFLGKTGIQSLATFLNASAIE